MTSNETSKLLRIMSANYPNYHPKNRADAIEVWTLLFADTPYDIVAAGLYTYMSQPHEFAPNPGQIKAIISTVKDDELSESEAWALVQKALRRSGYFAEEEFEKLPLVVQKAVGSPENLRTIAITEDPNLEVEQSLFSRRYRQALEDKRTIDAMPENVRTLIEGMKERLLA